MFTQISKILYKANTKQPKEFNLKSIKFYIFNKSEIISRDCVNVPTANKGQRFRQKSSSNRFQYFQVTRKRFSEF